MRRPRMAVDALGCNTRNALCIDFVSASKSSSLALILAAIGVVYGDIGTSVLYAVKEVFGHGHVPFTIENVYGILSMFFWTLTVIVSVKYVVLVLRADNEGEGGLVAMLALASQAVVDKPRLRNVLLVVGIFGTSLFYGDGVITPAISVLSAVEGLEVVSPRVPALRDPDHAGRAVLPVRGAEARHRGHRPFFGPITLIWFMVIALLGVSQIMTHPEILKALQPALRAALHVGQPAHQLHHPRRDGAVRDRRRGALR